MTQPELVFQVWQESGLQGLQRLHSGTLAYFLIDYLGMSIAEVKQMNPAFFPIFIDEFFKNRNQHQINI